MNNFITLLIPEKADPESDQVAAAWVKHGGGVRRLGKFWVRDEDLAMQKIAIYGNQAFAFVLAQIYNVELVSPDDTLIARLEHKWTKRTVQLKQAGQLTDSHFPLFAKPVVPKIFLAGIFQTLHDFQRATEGLPETEEILISNIIDTIQAEARCYSNDGTVRDIAFYEGSANLQEAEKFVADFITNNKEQLPRVVVIDIAFSEQTGWFVLEFNACWGAGLNSCNAEKVIDCIIGATVNNI
ncbi:ATP-grasp domain-containing protein [Niastella vici]|uniref:ATP-grasp domain-containing protein n=1 Tax=Niastella vici TaxID=1703345 RepID=UPI00117F95F0|nr:ATP-grasp domain-containing protein [Niastella vici]